MASELMNNRSLISPCLKHPEDTEQPFLTDEVCNHLDSVPDVFCWVDSSWTVGYLNAGVPEIPEVLSTARVGQNLWLQCPALVGTPFEQGLRKAMQEMLPVHLGASPLQGLGNRAGIHVTPFRDGLLIYLPATPSLQQVSLEARTGRSRELHAIMDLTPAFISYVDTDYRYRMVSKYYESYFGRPLEQILGKEMRQIIGEVAWQQVAPAMEQALGGRVAHFEAQFPVPGRGMRWSQGTYTPHIGTDGTVQGVVIFVKDITEQKHSERALKEKDAFMVRSSNHPVSATSKQIPRRANSFG